MKYRLYEKDYDLLLLLQEHNDGLSFAQLVEQLGRPAHEVLVNLEKLRAGNNLARLPGARYTITHENIPLIILTVYCPSCGTVRRVNNSKQQRATCLNPDCKFLCGKTRQFEIISRELLKKGIVQPIHRVR